MINIFKMLQARYIASKQKKQVNATSANGASQRLAMMPRAVAEPDEQSLEIDLQKLTCPQVHRNGDEFCCLLFL